LTPTDTPTITPTNTPTTLFANPGIQISPNIFNASEGDTVVYTIRVENYGPDTATNVVVDTNLPSGLNFVSSSTGTGTHSGNSWQIPSLNAGTVVTLDVTVTIGGGTSGTTITYAVSIASLDQTDQDPSNNSHSIPIGVYQANMGIQVAPSNYAPKEGNTITYTIRVDNYGPGSASGIVVDVSLPGQVTFVSLSAGQGNADTSNWNVGSLAGGTNAVLTIQVTINSGTANTSIPYTASITALNEVDGDTSNNTSTATITIQP
jgi:uncharacterized repeat protein (TIGR01451 family)